MVHGDLTGVLSVRPNPLRFNSMSFSTPFRVKSGSFLRVIVSSLWNRTGTRLPLFARSTRSLGSRETNNANTSRAVPKTRSPESPSATRSVSQACTTKSADRALRENCGSAILLISSTALDTFVRISSAERTVHAPSSLNAQFRFSGQPLKKVPNFIVEPSTLPRVAQFCDAPQLANAGAGRWYQWRSSQLSLLFPGPSR